MAPSVFITHPEVVIDAATPITEWPLSALGRQRALRLPELFRGRVDRVISSSESKASDTAAILAEGLQIPHLVDANLGELNRSATGYLPPEEFDAVVDLFFAHSDQSIRGWEPARDAQRRIVSAVRRHTRDRGAPATAFVSHGGVGALLLASLTTRPIDRGLEQPGLGSYFTFDSEAWLARGEWNLLPGRTP